MTENFHTRTDKIVEYATQCQKAGCRYLPDANRFAGTLIAPASVRNLTLLLNNLSYDEIFEKFHIAKNTLRNAMELTLAQIQTFDKKTATIVFSDNLNDLTIFGEKLRDHLVQIGYFHDTQEKS